MKNEQIKPKEEVPIELRLAVYKQALAEIEWKTNVEGLCHILPMLLWGFTYPLQAHDTLSHKYTDTIYMFPELKSELPKIYRATNDNLVRVNSLKRMIKKLEK